MHEAVLFLQRTVGNARTQMVLRQVSPLAEALPKTGPAAWSKEKSKAIQKELRRLRLYDKGIDGIIGHYSEQGLVEAMGSDDWRTMDSAGVLGRLTAAVRPPPDKKDRGKKAFRYGELYKDGVLDISMGIGYMEEDRGTYIGVLEDEFAKVLSDRGFKEAHDEGVALMEKGGRKLGKEAFGRFMVKKNAFSYSPPAGPAKQVSIVVRLIANRKGDKGKEALDAFRQGFTQGDVAYYSGHGRYGSGPDFDRNFAKFTLYDVPHDKGGRQTDVFDDYHLLQQELAKKGNPWAEFQRRWKDKTIKVDFTNVGNLRFSDKNTHGEFGAKLLHWAMNETGTKTETGKGGKLEQEVAKAPERKYRILVFEACRTGEYEKTLRQTKGFDSKSMDLIGTNRTIGFLAESEAFLAFLDGVVAQKSSEAVAKDMNTEMKAHEQGHTTAPFVATGMGDNPGR